MTTILSAEQDKFAEGFIAEYDIVNDGTNEPYITGVMDENIYSVDCLMEKVNIFLLASNQRVRLQTLQEVRGMIGEEKKSEHYIDRGV